MNKKGFVFIIFIALLCVTGYFWFSQKQDSAAVTPTLSLDKKAIMLGDTTLMAIDDATIFDWFKKESQLCTKENIGSTPDRKAFCEDKTVFKEQTRFASIVVAPNMAKIGFTIESDTLSPDTVAGIYAPTVRKLALLTNYYLGNKFISFSPNGTNFVYQGGCFEGKCGLIIKDSETLAEKMRINNPQAADEKTENAIFIRWISDNEFEYKLGTELKQGSF